MKALFLTLLLCSCTKYSHLTKDGVGLHVQEVSMDISRLNDVEWNVGKRRETKISQSFIFIVNMPRLTEEDLELLTEKKGVTAWIVRLIAVKPKGSQDLGSLYVPFKAKKITRGVKGGGAAKSVTIKVYYAAAFASEKFRHSKCPPFGHDKKIADMSIKGEDSQFELSFDQKTSYAEKSQMVELSPSSFNGGHSLLGEYHLEIAPYNFEKKIILSDFKRIPRYINVTREEALAIRSCEGEHPEFQ